MGLFRSISALELLRWKVLPKHHAFEHLTEDAPATLKNPRAYHCFMDEDCIWQWKPFPVEQHPQGWRKE